MTSAKTGSNHLFLPYHYIVTIDILSTGVSHIETASKAIWWFLHNYWCFNARYRPSKNTKFPNIKISIWINRLTLSLFTFTFHCFVYVFSWNWRSRPAYFREFSHKPSQNRLRHKVVQYSELISKEWMLLQNCDISSSWQSAVQRVIKVCNSGDWVISLGTVFDWFQNSWI